MAALAKQLCPCIGKAGVRLPVPERPIDVLLTVSVGPPRHGVVGFGWDVGREGRPAKRKPAGRRVGSPEQHVGEDIHITRHDHTGRGLHNNHNLKEK